MSKRIFVVEDHLAFCRVLVQLLKGMGDVEVCGQARDAEQALTGLAKAGADLVLVDLGLPGAIDGFDLATEIRRRLPQLTTVIVSGHNEQGFVDRARTLGVKGYVVKGDIVALRRAIGAVLAGKTDFPDYDKPGDAPAAHAKP